MVHPDERVQSRDMSEMTAEGLRAMEEAVENSREAHRLLNLINAEFQTDPMSVQCFDLRVVGRVKECVATRERLVREGVVVDWEKSRQ